MKNKIKIFVLVCILSISVGPLWAHPIAEELDQCIEQDPSTSGQVECIAIALEQWDQELNRVYTILMNRLDDESKATLRASQRQWIKFRDDELKFLADYYANFSGTMYVPMQAFEPVRITRDRTQQLQKYLNFLEDHAW